MYPAEMNHRGVENKAVLLGSSSQVLLNLVQNPEEYQLTEFLFPIKLSTSSSLGHPPARLHDPCLWVLEPALSCKPLEALSFRASLICEPATHLSAEEEGKAIEELLKEAKRGKTRAETMGPMGWMKCPLAGTNKRFLLNTIKNTLPSQKEQDQEQKEEPEEPARSPRRKEGSPRKHRAHPYKCSAHRSKARHSPSRKRSTHDKSQRRSSKR
ncbi:PREDICTED: uncharacterized protein LOC102855947 [Elephantulus edwardii]|uniref:uncharacterized protein LOC102855947 n=1 Tax=Elephantulus edwardii TaxID=28737 RepID=UPI0003F0EF65|nr:PREDICTED: uncharacterized protein LOC102855947 [Elephantulus edwardii]